MIIMNARTIMTAATAIAIGLSLSSCVIVKKSEHRNGKDDKLVTRNISLSDFNSISNEFIADVKYTQGPTSFTVSAPQYILDRLSVEVRDSVLVIGNNKDDGRINDVPNVKVTCSSPNLKSVNVDGMGDFEWKGGTAGNLKLVVNGMGDLKWENGHCESLEMYINGMGDIECKNITGNSIIGAVEGHGDIEISGSFVSGRLSIEGLGDIDAKKLDCPALSTSVDGMGKIKR